MKIKVICGALCLVMLALTFGVAFADNGIMPCYVYVSSVAATLTIDDGVATAMGKISPKNGQRTSIIVRLQQERSEGYWTTIATWTDSNSSVQSEAGGTKAVDFGYNYRVYVTGRVYSSEGRVLESVNRYSQVKSYGASN